VVSRVKTLELLRPDDVGKLQVIVSYEVFGCIRSLATFRVPGAKTDHLIIGSDSGRIVVLEYKKDKGTFRKVHQETFGKSGCRRIVPGQHLAADPKGRACLIGAVEKQKLVYVLNRDSSGQLTISSPLEAHKSHHLTYDIVGMDMGYDNPVFAAIELDYAEADQDATGEAAAEAQKHLTLYELDLGLNHVMRKHSEPIDNGANLLISVPGEADGPGGVLVCAENFIIWKNEGQPEVRAVIPRRSDLPADRGVLIVSYATHKQKSMFFFLVQSEYGDIYKVTLDYTDETVSELKIKYFDTIPPCASICVLKTGFLFAASEFGNHCLYQFQGIGENDDAVESSSANLMETDEGFSPIFFTPHPLTNLLLIDEMESLSPILDMKVENLLNEETPQIYALCGRGPRSTLRVLRSGLGVTEMAASPLPSNPTAVWTVRTSMANEYDSYIIVSFSNATLVLSIGETVEEVSDSGFQGSVPTLCCQLMEDDTLIQVHQQGIRHIGAGNRVVDWQPPGRRHVQKAAANSSQVVIALSGGDLMYFEIDPRTGLTEIEKKDMRGDVACLDIAPVPEGRQRSKFLAVGDHASQVRILGLDQENCLATLAVQAVPAVPASLLIIDSPGAGDTANEEDAGAGSLFLHTGLSSGVLLRTELDRVTGTMSDTRTRFLGTRAPKLFRTMVRGNRAMLALSSRPWLGYSHMGRFNLTPLSYEALDHADSFASDQCPEGFVAVSKSTLRIITIERLAETFNQMSTRLRYTPRCFTVHPEQRTLIIAESENAAIPSAEREDLADVMSGEGALKGVEFDEERAAQEEQFGAPKGGSGQWASCLRIVDPADLSTTEVLELDNNEAALSLCLVQFSTRQDLGTLLAVGTAQGLQFYPRQVEGGFIRLYRMDAGRKLSLLHKTPVDGIPRAMAAFQGRLLVGVNHSLRLYDVGKKKLLRKCENRHFPTMIMTIHCLGDRIYVGDCQESFQFVRYKPAENEMYIYADDILPRYVTAALNLDYDTMAGADKFGNMYVTRLPADVSSKVEDDPTGGKLVGVTGLLNGAPHKLDNIVQFHVGDTVTAMSRAVMQPGGAEVILHASVMGGLGALLPLTSREDVDFFMHLEMHMRQEHPPLCGRDHMAFRSAYCPAKDVVDGDLCEQFASLPYDLQRRIAEELDRSPGEVLKKLEDIRNKIL